MTLDPGNNCTREEPCNVLGSGLGARGSGFGVWDSGFGLRASGIGVRGSGRGFGVRGSGLGVRGFTSSQEFLLVYKSTFEKAINWATEHKKAAV